MTAGPPIRVLHVVEAGFGWHFTSPDVDGMVGGGTTYEESRARAEFLVRSHLESHKGHARSGPTAATVRFAHFVDETAAGVREEPNHPAPTTPPL